MRSPRSSRATGTSVPVIFFAGYLAGMALLFGALVAIGRVMYQIMVGRGNAGGVDDASPPHHADRRQLAGGVLPAAHAGIRARRVGDRRVSARPQRARRSRLSRLPLRFTRRRPSGSASGSALPCSSPSGQWRIPLAALGALAACAAVWAVTYGPLRGHLDRMDPLWASAMAGKDYIFPSDWTPRSGSST